MVQQRVESKFNEYGLSNSDANLSTCDKQFPVTAKKTALRDVQNENRNPHPIGNSPLTKDRGQIMDSVKVSGTKRPSTKDPVSNPHHQSPTSNAANAQLVYVRRKSEAEAGKTTVVEGRCISADCLNPRQLDHTEDAAQPKLQIKELKASCFPAFASIPVASLTTSSGKPSIPLPVFNTNTRFAAADPNYNHVVSVVPSSNNLKGMNNLHWEERFQQLHILLKKLDESDQEDYVQMLRSLSSVELSRHAVELEKRSIQLSLEEAKEVQRLGILNVLGKAMKASTNCEGQAGK